MAKRTVIEAAIDHCVDRSAGTKDGFNSIVCEDGYRMTLEPVFDGDENVGVDVLVDREFAQRINYSDDCFFKKIERIFLNMAVDHNNDVIVRR